jgi:hypothetical protein
MIWKSTDKRISYLLHWKVYPKIFLATSKGQLISEWLFGVFNFPKNNNAKIWWISALESKKSSNQKDKGTLLVK